MFKEKDMAKLAKDNTYHYENRDLGFKVNLPAEFQYYQVQRKEVPDYIDVEFFVPTNDTAYPQEVPSYAKPLVVRIFTEESWGRIRDDSDEKKFYQKTKEKGGKVYTVRFWDKIPTDWQRKWKEEIKVQIIKSFKNV